MLTLYLDEIRPRTYGDSVADNVLQVLLDKSLAYSLRENESSKVCVKSWHGVYVSHWYELLFFVRVRVIVSALGSGIDLRDFLHESSKASLCTRCDVRWRSVSSLLLSPIEIHIYPSALGSELSLPEP